MDAKQAHRATMDMSLFVLKSYLGDLSDAELMTRPGPGCNHLAWQLGHLISAEVGLLKDISSQPPAELPAGFTEQHGKDKTGENDPTKFLTKQQYLDLFDQVRVKTVAALESMSDADFAKPSPERFRKFFPTVGDMMVLIATHPMMHAGQFAVTRRVLGKPVVI